MSKTELLRNDLWLNVKAAKNRFENFFGEEHARLSRDQARVDDRSIERPRTLNILYRLLWRCPEKFLRLFDAMWIDQRVVKFRWDELIRSCTTEWKESLYLVSSLKPKCDPCADRLFFNLVHRPSPVSLPAGFPFRSLNLLQSGLSDVVSSMCRFSGLRSAVLDLRSGERIVKLISS